MIDTRYKLISISMMTLVILLMGCTKANVSKETVGVEEETASPLTAQKEKQDITQVIADLEWEFIFTEEKELPDSTLTYPTTALFLKSKTNPECRIDLKHEVVGPYLEEEQGRDIYPKDAYLPLMNWYGGGGESVMIKLEDASSFYIMVNPLEEGTRDYEGRGVSASWEDYKPIAKVDYTLNEKGEVESLTCENYEVDYNSFFEDNETLPRIPIKQNNESYQKFFPNGVILQNYRIDLEGDGQDEVVLIVQETEEIYLVLRKIGADGEVFTLKESMNKNTLGDVKLVGIADVQGDGIMEIIVESEEWGNPGYKVYTPDENYFTEVFGDIEDIHCWH